VLPFPVDDPEVAAKVNEELLERWKLAARRGETVNVTRDVSLMVLKFTVTLLFGRDYEEAAPYCAIFAEESARNLEVADALRPFAHFILELVERRRRAGKLDNDALGHLMQARDRDSGESMTDDQIAREAMTIVVGGHETTASLLNWMWYLLARHPQVQEKLAAELESNSRDEVLSVEALAKYPYARQVIDESLRIYPPLWLMTRKALKDDELGGYFVPAGTEIYISPYLIQRNPQLWEMPDHFDPDRMSKDKVQARHELAMCPFGAGPRNCIGEFLALVEAQMHLVMFARELTLRYDETKPPEISTGLNLLSKHDFLMRPQLKAVAVTT